MIPELLGRLIWGTGRMALRYVIVPMAVTALAAAVLKDIAGRVEAQGNHQVRLAPMAA